MAAQVDFIKFEDVAKRHYHALNSSISKQGMGRLYEVWASEATDIGTLSNGAKLLKSILNLAAIFTQVEPVKNGAKFFTGVADAVKVLGIGKSAQDIQTNKGKSLKVASAALGITSAAGAAFKIMDSVKLIELSRFSAALGRIPKIGPFLSFATIFNVVDIAKAVIDIIGNAQKIREFDAARGVAIQKKNKWTDAKKTGLDLPLKQAKIDALTKKIADGKLALASEAAKNQKAAIVKAVEEAKDAADAARKELVDAKGFSVIIAKVRAHRTNTAERNAIIAYAKSELATKAQEKKIQQQENDLANWNNGDFKANEKSYLKNKISKWEIKANNSRWEIVKESLGLSLNSVLIVALVASTVFAGLAMFGLMAVSLPVSSAFLAISLLGIGIHFLKKYKPAQKYEHVRLNDFAAKA